MRRTWNVVLIGVTGIYGLAAVPTHAQDYPRRPLRIITTNPGGSSDVVARLVAAGLTRQLNQQVVVDNRPTPFPGLIAAKAPADGYTLLVGNSSLWILPLLREVAYDT